MAGGFRVELDVLGQKAQYVQGLVPQIQSTLNQLNGEMESLFGTWKGQASASFQRLHVNWQQDYQQLNRSLDNIGRELQNNQRSYQSSDQASTVNR